MPEIPGVTNYFTANGEIIGESTAGSRTDYLTDAIGSVIGTVSSSGAIEDTFVYKPYGSLLAQVGSATVPFFGWIGSYGYKSTTLKHAEQYVLARHYGEAEGMWTTVDPLWPGEPAYLYSMQSPTSQIDPSGLSCVQLELCGLMPGWWEFHLRGRSFYETLSRVEGYVWTPQCCNNGLQNWYTFYTATASADKKGKVGTNTECGVKAAFVLQSETRNFKRGWQGFTAAPLTGVDVPGLHENALVFLDMVIGPHGKNGTCKIATTVGIVSAPINHTAQSEMAQFTIGGIIVDPLNDNSSGHSYSYWLSMFVNNVYMPSPAYFLPCNYCPYPDFTPCYGCEDEWTYGVMGVFRHPCGKGCSSCCTTCSLTGT